MPDAQTMLLIRFIREDLDGYSAFMWVEVGEIKFLVLISYDVNIQMAAGKKPLHQVAVRC